MDEFENCEYEDEAYLAGVAARAAAHAAWKVQWWADKAKRRHGLRHLRRVRTKQLSIHQRRARPSRRMP